MSSTGFFLLGLFAGVVALGLVSLIPPHKQDPHSDIDPNDWWRFL